MFNFHHLISYLRLILDFHFHFSSLLFIFILSSHRIFSFHLPFNVYFSSSLLRFLFTLFFIPSLSFHLTLYLSHNLSLPPPSIPHFVHLQLFGVHIQDLGQAISPRCKHLGRMVGLCVLPIRQIPPGKLPVNNASHSIPVHQNVGRIQVAVCKDRRRPRSVLLGCHPLDFLQLFLGHMHIFFVCAPLPLPCGDRRAATYENREWCQTAQNVAGCEKYGSRAVNRQSSFGRRQSQVMAAAVFAARQSWSGAGQRRSGGRP